MRGAERRTLRRLHFESFSRFNSFQTTAAHRYTIGVVYRCAYTTPTLPSPTFGSVGFKGSRRSTRYVAQANAEYAARVAIQLGFKFVEVRIKGLGYGKESSFRGLNLGCIR
ncbi:hypothetical protein MPTK1_4g09870 [Marchantia polymorpha subsp. ruderalis]|uniref:Ribosomal protein S11 n=2 Tax=Marchantia polymorpha TaxID=3197 RepID=A0AAF6B891_MARPO|nr:hypothetical protein MARPO_0132s0030 [Marchantia polymorpha]BBN08225.1 hypothetical protein Mp_4g09870 [Marchantia polymorpha subsp. ruderalis]|eukprot:PTQ29955.1 hypothetical protein MARPO_0132s0030 [Marchantia polymorpha]